VFSYVVPLPYPTLFLSLGFVLNKRKADFELSEEIADRLDGEEGLERVRDLRKQFLVSAAYLVENKDSIEGDEAEELD
jgi:hypothetical protein